VPLVFPAASGRDGAGEKAPGDRPGSEPEQAGREVAGREQAGRDRSADKRDADKAGTNRDADKAGTNRDADKAGTNRDADKAGTDRDVAAKVSERSTPEPGSSQPGSSQPGSLAGTSSGLPSRRPGAALAGGPLSSSRSSFDAFGDLSAAPTLPPIPPAPSGDVAGPVVPRFEAPQTSDLPRRTRGSALAGTPLAGPPATPTPLNGIEASKMFGPATPSVDPLTELGEGREATDAGSTSSGPAIGTDGDQQVTVGDGMVEAESPEAESDDGDDVDGPAPRDRATTIRRPIRPFVQPRDTAGAPVARTGPAARPPFRPGATGAQAGASAATAAAAAARARAAAGGSRSGTPGSGLFAATGPATQPGGIIRPPASAPDVGADAGRTIALAAAEAASAVDAPTMPAPVTDAPATDATAAGIADALRPGPQAPMPVPPAAEPVREAPQLGVPSPTEVEALTVAALRYQPADPQAPMIGAPDDLMESSTPIFDSISAWFTTEPATADASEQHTVIDLRDTPATVGATATSTTTSTGGTSSGRWSTLGDQRWLATNARAAAAPEVAGNTEAGLPRRQPGANLLPSALEAAPASASSATSTGGVTRPAAPAPAPSGTSPVPVAGAGTGSPAQRPAADVVRGRLGSYQRGLTSARRARHLPGVGGDTPELGESESQPQDVGQGPADQGGDQ
jgi:hypothetical protein